MEKLSSRSSKLTRKYLCLPPLGPFLGPQYKTTYTEPVLATSCQYCCYFITNVIFPLLLFVNNAIVNITKFLAPSSYFVLDPHILIQWLDWRASLNWMTYDILFLIVRSTAMSHHKLSALHLTCICSPLYYLHHSGRHLPTLLAFSRHVCLELGITVPVFYMFECRLSKPPSSRPLQFLHNCSSSAALSSFAFLASFLTCFVVIARNMMFFC